MATSNFSTMNYDLPLIVFGMGVDYEERKKEWEEENGGEYGEYNDDLYESDIEYQSECVEEDLKEFNNKHRFFEIEQRAGYYQGIQLQVNFVDKYWDYETIMDDKNFTDEEADYYYGETAEEVREAVKKELEEVREYLLNCKKSMGFLELYKYAQFSNGEAIYKEVKE